MRTETDTATSLVDQRGRALRDLRISVTDRCNMRCAYCMPEAEYAWLPRDDILSFEELTTVVAAFVDLGVNKVRLTGGEPTLRRNLPGFIAQISALPELDDVSLTSNGSLLVAHATDLHAAGLNRVTVSLDTLHANRHAVLTQRDNHADVIAGIRALVAAGFSGTKINSVVIRETNDDELADMLDFGASVDAEVRFIEYMDVGGATNWDVASVVTADEILLRLRARFGEISPVVTRASAPARRYSLPDGRVFGIVASTTTPFCSSCDRSRITADGMWFGCLYASTGVDLRTPLRGGADARDMRDLIATQWRARNDQGAVDRLNTVNRETAVPVELLRRDPHLEMHTRGG